jgi:hypothetical protein
MRLPAQYRTVNHSPGETTVAIIIVFVIRLTNALPSDGRAICAWRNPVPQFDDIHDVTVSATSLRIDLEMS